MTAKNVSRAVVLAAAAISLAACAPAFRSEKEFSRTTQAPPTTVAATTTREVTVLASPSDGARAVGQLPAGTEVLASDSDFRGYRRVKTPDGKGGYVEEKALSIGKASPQDSRP
jgi:hypothetical protein